MVTGSEHSLGALKRKFENGQHADVKERFFQSIRILLEAGRLTDLPFILKMAKECVCSPLYIRNDKHDFVLHIWIHDR